MWQRTSSCSLGISKRRDGGRWYDRVANCTQVRVPRIHWEATARRVLTMEWIDGVKLTDRARMAAKGLEVVDFVDVGVECTLRQLLDKGYFHAGVAAAGALIYAIAMPL